MSRAQRQATAICSVAGVACVVVLATLAYEPLAENYYLWRLDSEDEAVQATAAYALANRRSEKAVPRLFDLVPDWVAGAIPPGQIGGSIFWVGVGWRPVREPMPANEQFAVRALTQMGEPAVPHLVDKLLDEDETVSRRAAVVVAFLQDHRRAIARLVDALREQAISEGINSYGFLHRAGELLSQFGRPASLPVSELLDDDHPDVRRAAALVLEDLRKEAVDALPALVECLKAYPSTRGTVVLAIRRVGPKAKDFAPTLLEVLHEEQDPKVRRLLRESISRMGIAVPSQFLETSREGDGTKGL